MLWWFLESRLGRMLLLGLVMAILPAFLENSFHYDIVIRIGFNAIVCVGLNLLIGYAGQISLGHAGFLGLGAYGAAVLTDQYGWPGLLAMLVSAIAVAFIAFVIARPILRLKGHYLAMATLGMGMIISIILNTEDQITGGPDGMVSPDLVIFGHAVWGDIEWYLIVCGVLMLAVWLAENLIQSPIGRALRAVHGSEVAAQTVGVDTASYKVTIFVVSAVFAAVVGSLYAFYSDFLSPHEAGFFHSIELVVMVVLGGMASVYGAVVGAAILTVLPQLLTVFDDYKHVVLGLVMMLTMIFLSKGLVPTLARMIGVGNGERRAARKQGGAQ